MVVEAHLTFRAGGLISNKKSSELGQNGPKEVDFKTISSKLNQPLPKLGGVGKAPFV